jgi:hypothetical protein
VQGRGEEAEREEEQGNGDKDEGHSNALHGRIKSGLPSMPSSAPFAISAASKRPSAGLLHGVSEWRLSLLAAMLVQRDAERRTFQ